MNEVLSYQGSGAPGHLRASGESPGVGAGQMSYEPVPYWGRIPHGMGFAGNGTSVAVDSNDRVYVFNRGPFPVLVFGADGEYLRTMGAGEFERPHAIVVGEDDCLWLIDDVAHSVQKRANDGEILLELEGQRPAPEHSGERFNRPTDIAIRPATGELFVSDGYKNSSIHRFSPDGEYMMSWGSPGSHPGQFSLPHNVAFLDDDRLVVCDRENHRLQFFSPDGEWLEAWHAHHPSSVYWHPGTGLLYVGEMPPRLATGQVNVPNLGARVKVFDPAGTIAAEFGGPYKGTGTEVDRFVTPHGVSVDASGAVYIAEVAANNLSRDGELPTDREVIGLRKWVPAAG